MTKFTIADTDLTNLKDKVIIVTGKIQLPYLLHFSAYISQAVRRALDWKLPTNSSV